MYYFNVMYEHIYICMHFHSCEYKCALACFRVVIEKELGTTKCLPDVVSINYGG